MPYSAKAIANEFLRLAKTEDIPIQQMKLQKLVYIAHAYNLALLNDKLIEDSIQAWEYGPVIPILYSEFRAFGRNQITKFATQIVIDDNFNVSEEELRTNTEDTQTRDLIIAVWEKYKPYTGPNLSDLTHRSGTHWDSIYSQGIGKFDNISDELIRDYYRTFLGL